MSPEFDALDAGTFPPDPDGRANLEDQDRHDDGIDMRGLFIFSSGAPPNVADIDVYVTAQNSDVADHDPGGRYGGGGHGADDGVHAALDDKFI